MGTTPNYNLELPDKGTPNWDSKVNNNFNIIDTELKDTDNKIGNLLGLNTQNKTDLVSAINEHETQLNDMATNVTSYSTIQDALASNNNTLIFPQGFVINGDLLIDNIQNKILIFQNITVTGKVRFSRIQNLDIQGIINANNNIEVIGSKHCTFDTLKCKLFYLQNYAGWGGVYWNNFKEIQCSAIQVRQAKLISDVSGINNNHIFKLIAQYGLSENNWINVWFRSGASGSNFEYTTYGTDSSLIGDAKWDTLYSNPFIIENFDFSYSNAPNGSNSYGIVHEGDRPIYIRYGFIENVTYATKGKIISEGMEIRNSSPYPIYGFNFSPSEVVGKVGSYKTIPQGIVENCEFNQGARGFSGSGISIVSASAVNADVNKTGNILRITQNDSSISKLIYTFTANRTGFISIVVRGKNIGQITAQDGANTTQYTLGNAVDSVNYGYSVGRQQVTKGNVQTITVYTPAYTTLGIGQITDISGFQIFYGTEGTDISQQNTELKSSTQLPQSVGNPDWKNAFHVTGNGVSGKTKISFEVEGNVAGRGNFRGFYEGILAFDASGNYDSTNSSTTLKSFVYDTGQPTTGVASFDIQFITRVDNTGITCQFSKQYFGTGATANFYNIKVTNFATVVSLTY